MGLSGPFISTRYEKHRFGIALALLYLEGINEEMVAFLMMGVLALLSFLCVSETIPPIARSLARPRRRARPLDRPVRDRFSRFKRIEVLVEKS